ncbi:hypothetical protein LPJ66_010950 [Kickxella alabastrina]|uniref:Uncharacterized protein n=1 Tax=Kickxella alabastrina TaxID=61397 RepID=A0ACC1HZ10_9FUNG|nr:hypothetical protein LPJ66_010950 [Kickxella alabastrina]
MVKIFATAIATAALLQCAWAHMGIISPPPRSGIVGDQLNKPCGGSNALTRNVTTFSVDALNDFVLRPSHGTGNLIFNYFTDITVTNDSIAHPIIDVPIPAPNTYTTPLDFAKAGLKNGQSIVVQAIYNGTDHDETEQYYVCFDVKLSADADTVKSDSADDKESEDAGLDSKTDDAKDESKSSSSSSAPKSALVSTKAVIGAAAGLLVAAFAF